MHRLSSTMCDIYVCTPTSRVTRSTSIVCSVRQSILASLFWNTNGALPLGGACFVAAAAWWLEWFAACLDPLRGFSQSLRNVSSLSSVSVVYPVEEAMTMRPGSLIAFPMSLGELPTLSLVLADSNNCFLGCVWRIRRLRATTVPAATFEHVRVFLSAAHTAWAGCDSPLNARLTIPCHHFICPFDLSSLQVSVYVHSLHSRPSLPIIRYEFRRTQQVKPNLQQRISANLLHQSTGKQQHRHDLLTNPWAWSHWPTNTHTLWT